MLRGMVVLGLVALISFFWIANGFCEEGKPVGQAFQPAVTEPVVGRASQPAVTEPVVGRASQPAVTEPVVGRASQPAVTEPVVGRASQPAVLEPSGIELLSELLKAKGVISPDEAAALKAKTTGAESAEGVKALVDLLKNKGLVSDGEADQLNQVLAKKPTPNQVAAKSILVVPRDKEYVQKITENVANQVKQDVREQVKTEVDEKSKDPAWLASVAPSLPEWTRRFHLSGDMRLRYEGDYFPGTNGTFVENVDNPVPNPPTSINTENDRQRERLRARLLMEADVNDCVVAGVRLATGTTESKATPVSTNVTFGDYFQKNGFLLDQAYLKITPANGMTIWGGRIPNPWLYSTLVWDPNLNFEGVAASYNRELWSPLSAFITAGAFPLQEIELSQRDKYLLGAQAGLEYKCDGNFTAKVAAAIYDYENTVGRLNPLNLNTNDYTTPLFMQKGNTVFNIFNGGTGTPFVFALASEFQELDLLGTIDVALWDPIHVIFLADYVKNVAFNVEKTVQLSGRNPHDMQDYGYQAGLTVGYPTPRKRWQWNMFAYYKYVGTDSVVDSFTDSDFHLGGTNAKGWIIGGELGIMKNVWLTARWLSADQISPFQFSNGPFSVDVIQVDTNAAF